MTPRSQDRQHTGKRGAAQRKARREGYHDAANVYALAKQYLHPAMTFCGAVNEMWALGMFDSRQCPHLAAAFRHGAHDWARKHGGGA